MADKDVALMENKELLIGIYFALPQVAGRNDKNVATWGETTLPSQA